MATIKLITLWSSFKSLLYNSGKNMQNWANKIIAFSNMLEIFWSFEYLLSFKLFQEKKNKLFQEARWWVKVLKEWIYVTQLNNYYFFLLFFTSKTKTAFCINGAQCSRKFIKSFYIIKTRRIFQRIIKTTTTKRIFFNSFLSKSKKLWSLLLLMLMLGAEVGRENGKDT